MTRAAGKALLGLVAVLALAGCERPEVRRAEAAAETPNNVLVDKETGCQYLHSFTLHSLTPRIAADGKTHMGCSQGAKP